MRRRAAGHPESMPSSKTVRNIDGHRVTLTNLDKVLYPAAGFTKGDVIAYYERVASVLLPHVRGRPASFKRFPDGVGSEGFFAKQAPLGTPSWVRTASLPSPESTKGRAMVRHVLVDDVPTLLWTANLAALEFHVPQWRLGSRNGRHGADQLVFDLDPGEPATVVECCQVACLLREELGRDGLQAWPKTSGSKGVHLYVPIAETADSRTTAYARRLAARLTDRHPALVIDRMERQLRRGKVFVDWSQNDAGKTTVAPYSLRARDAPTVSTPVTWDEVEACRMPDDMRFLPGNVLERIGGTHADLLEPLLSMRQRLPRSA
jgi:bifunctional non-homologous end joining protein LigD